MNAKPLDRRIFETKHAEEGRVYKQATPKSERAGYRPPRRNHNKGWYSRESYRLPTAPGSRYGDRAI